VFPIKDNIPGERFPLVTIALILANVVVYLLSIRHGGSLISGPDNLEVFKYGAIPKVLTHCLTQNEVIDASQGAIGCAKTGGRPVWETAFSSMFMHASILHIGGNMLFLWIFGNNVEDAMGPVRFLIFYLLGGVAALGLQVAVGPNTLEPTLGASGAIAAVLGGYIVLHPRARVLTLVFIIFFFGVIELPALVMLGIWFVQQAVFGAVGLTSPGNAGGGVAYFAHVGGFAFGLLTIRLAARRDKPTPPTRSAYR
jgi:membrane associated rhomboid family serine protease